MTTKRPSSIKFNNLKSRRYEEKDNQGKNAQVYFVLSLNQMLSGLIPARVLCDRLRKLRSLIAQNSALYHAIGELLPCAELWIDRGISQEDKAQLDALAKKESVLMCFLRKHAFRVADPDIFPFVPHIHDNFYGKLDVFTGYWTNGGRLPDKEFADLWNDEKFVKKIKAHMADLSVRKTSVGSFESREFPEVACVPYTK